MVQLGESNMLNRLLFSSMGLVAGLLCAVIVGINHNIVSAALPLPESGEFDAALTSNPVVTFADKATNKGVLKKALMSLVSGGLLTSKIILGGVALIYIALALTDFIWSQGEEEVLTKSKKAIGWVLLGLGVLAVGETLVTTVFDPAGGNIITGDPKASESLWQNAIQVRHYFYYIIGAVALLAMAKSGYSLIIAGDKEETVQEEKLFWTSFVVAGAIILLSEVIVTIFSGGGGINQTGLGSGEASAGIAQLTGLVNFLLTFVSVMAMIVLVIAALYYVISFGEEEKTTAAKKMIFAAIAALIIAFSSFVIIKTFVDF